MALLWAAGICWFAIDVARSAKEGEGDGNTAVAADQSGDSFTAKDVAAFEDNIASLK